MADRALTEYINGYTVVASKDLIHIAYGDTVVLRLSNTYAKDFRKFFEGLEAFLESERIKSASK